jgi:rhodanese-related sulfurtransferase
MAMPGERLPRGIEQLLEEARKSVRTVSAAEAIELSKDPDWLIVDVREAKERERDGYVPNSFHCPRGMVEFWIDPGSPYYKSRFGEHKNILFHCALDWRSSLTVHTVQQMGIRNAFHIEGGLAAWKKADGPLTMLDKSS